MVLLSLSALGVGAYGISKFYAPDFGSMVVVFALSLWTFEAIAQTFSALFRNPLVGMLVFICTW